MTMAVTDLIPRIRPRKPLLRAASSGTNPLIVLHDEMNRLFEDFWRHFDDNASSLPMLSTSFPRVEISETDKEVQIHAELPGLDEKDIEVLLDDGVLTLRGEKRSESKDTNRRVSERYYGRFEREISLPTDVREDQVNASFKNGVLTVRLPKSEAAVQRAKRIPIKVS
jgi:HSP20 family protein